MLLEKFKALVVIFVSSLPLRKICFPIGFSFISIVLWVQVWEIPWRCIWNLFCTEPNATRMYDVHLPLYSSVENDVGILFQILTINIEWNQFLHCSNTLLYRLHLNWNRWCKCFVWISWQQHPKSSYTTTTLIERGRKREREISFIKFTPNSKESLISLHNFGYLIRGSRLV